MTEIKNELIQATLAAARELFDHSGETFYYFGLFTSGEAHPPVISAWSHEKLALVPLEKRQLVKWSYADSPYFDFGSEYFAKVRELFTARPSLWSMDDVSREAEYELRLRTMEEAMAEVDAKGVFGAGTKREGIVITVEVMPPDYTNTERVIRLNPAGALKQWLDEAAE